MLLIIWTSLAGYIYIYLFILCCKFLKVTKRYFVISIFVLRIVKFWVFLASVDFCQCGSSSTWCIFTAQFCLHSLSTLWVASVSRVAVPVTSVFLWLIIWSSLAGYIFIYLFILCCKLILINAVDYMKFSCRIYLFILCCNLILINAVDYMNFSCRIYLYIFIYIYLFYAV